MQRKRRHTASTNATLQDGITRRDLIKGALGLGAMAALPGCASFSNAAGSDLVRRENERPGTRDWMLKNTRIDPATKYRCPWIEGYCSHTSVRAGENIQFFVSTNPTSPNSLQLSPSSPAIDAGIDVGLPYKGSHPDIGAVEYGVVDTAPPAPPT